MKYWNFFFFFRHLKFDNEKLYIESNISSIIPQIHLFL
jgi:hypothetical protein